MHGILEARCISGVIVIFLSAHVQSLSVLTIRVEIKTQFTDDKTETQKSCSSVDSLN